MFKIVPVFFALGVFFKFSQKKPATVLNMDTPEDYPNTTASSTAKNARKEKQEIPKVLIFSQTRSGSSFLGSLLTVPEDSFYVFEPFMNLSFNETSFEKIVNKKNIENSVIDSIKAMIGKIYNCDHENVVRFTHQIQVDNSKMSECQKSSVKVIKSVRLRASVLQSWIEHSDIKVIHLVRDPRAIFNSRRLLKWDPDIVPTCSNLKKDLMLEKVLPPKRYGWLCPTSKNLTLNMSRYVRLRYEDMVKDTTVVIKNLYSFIGIPFTANAEKEILRLKNGEKDSNQFFGVQRSADWNINHWRQKMPLKLIQHIENSCEDFMKTMNYIFLTDSRD